MKISEDSIIIERLIVEECAHLLAETGKPAATVLVGVLIWTKVQKEMWGHYPLILDLNTFGTSVRMHLFHGTVEVKLDMSLGQYEILARPEKEPDVGLSVG